MTIPRALEDQLMCTDYSINHSINQSIGRSIKVESRGNDYSQNYGTRGDHYYQYHGYFVCLDVRYEIGSAKQGQAELI